MEGKKSVLYPKKYGNHSTMSRLRRHNRDILLIFFNMKVCCVFVIELPHRGDSDEYTQNTIFNNKKKITLNYPKSATIGFFTKGLKE